MKNNKDNYVHEDVFVIANEIIKEQKIIYNYYNNMIKKNPKIESEILDLEKDLTQLKLQKLLYLVYGYYYACTSQKLFNAEFEAWQFGPVIKKVYDKSKSTTDSKNNNLEYIKNYLKKNKLENVKLNWADDDNNARNKNTFEKILFHFSMYSTWMLVAETHNTEPWQKYYYNKNNHKIISIKSIENWFNQKNEKIQKQIKLFKTLN